MNIDEKIGYWLDLAEDDFITAEIILKSKRYLHFGFLCHLSVEKLLKAYFWKNNSLEPPYTHSLLILSSKSGLNKNLDEKFKKLIYKLMPLNIEARYPTNKQEIYKLLSPDYCQEIFIETKEFFEWIKTLLKS
jgi:HEPN domain-containing protein